MTWSKTLIYLAAIILLPATQAYVSGQTTNTRFGYQGRLTDSGNPANGSYDLEARLYDAPTTGNQVAGTVVIEDMSVVSGFFSTGFDFGSAAFSGAGRWLQLGIRPGSSIGAFTALSPRQELLPAPGALYANTAGSVPGGTTGTGTPGRIAKFSSAGSLGDSAIYQSSQGRIGIRGEPYWGGISPGTGPDLHVNTSSDLAQVWIGGNRSTPGQAVGELSFVGSAGGVLGLSSYATITGQIVSSNPWPRGELLFYTSEGPTIPPQSPAEKMRITPDGKVGIGVAAPVNRLEVAGTVGSTSGGFSFPDGSLQVTAAGDGAAFWAASGSDIYSTNDGHVGIGTSVAGTAKLRVKDGVHSSGSNRAAQLTADSPWTDCVLYVKYEGTGSNDIPAIYGYSVPDASHGYGYGGRFIGGASGVKGEVYPTGTMAYAGVSGEAQGGAGQNAGVAGHANGSGISKGVAGLADGTGTNYGVYGWASGGSTNYAAYFEGPVSVTAGSIRQNDAGPGYGEMSVMTAMGAIDANKRFIVIVPRALWQTWSYDNFLFKTEVFVSLDYDSVYPHTNRGSAYSEALIGKERGAGLTHFTQLHSQSFDAAVTFAYDQPSVDNLRITVTTDKPAGINYKATVKISH